METLAAINRWLAKQHVVTGASVKTSVGAQTPFVHDPGRVTFAVGEDKTLACADDGPAGKSGGRSKRSA